MNARVDVDTPHLSQKQMHEILDRYRVIDGKGFRLNHYESIVDFERHLARQGVVVLKFFLHLSREEQRRRFLARLEEKDKQWKFSAADLNERTFWDQYQQVYEEAIGATAAPHAPWFVVPADNKWFTRLVVVATIIEALGSLNLKIPQPSAEQLAALEVARRRLEAEGARHATIPSNESPRTDRTRQG